MVVEMLERLGMFAGKRQDGYKEALFFLRFNQWLMFRCGATWDHPDPVLQLFDGEQTAAARAIAQACAEAIVASPHTVSYLGYRRFLRHRRLDRLTFTWGWKDPRSTFTLPLWLHCFPHAKVIHVIRHGVDVADSLFRRHVASVAGGRESFAARRGRYLLTPRRPRFFDTVTCSSLSGSFQVWERYASEARRQIQSLGARAMELRYEDLLISPGDTLSTVARFCEIDASRDALQAAERHAKADRAYAFQRRADLAEFAGGLKDRLTVYGYDN